MTERPTSANRRADAGQAPKPPATLGCGPYLLVLVAFVAGAVVADSGDDSAIAAFPAIVTAAVGIPQGVRHLLYRRRQRQWRGRQVAAAQRRDDVARLWRQRAGNNLVDLLQAAGVRHPFVPSSILAGSSPAGVVGPEPQRDGADMGKVLRHGVGVARGGHEHLVGDTSWWDDGTFMGALAGLAWQGWKHLRPPRPGPTDAPVPDPAAAAAARAAALAEARRLRDAVEQAIPRLKELQMVERRDLDFVRQARAWLPAARRRRQHEVELLADVTAATAAVRALTEASLAPLNSILQQSDAT